jgi:hypothetical protein
MATQEVSGIINEWVESRHLSRRKLAFLETVYTQMADEILSGGYPSEADWASCQEVGLDSGSYWVQVVASLLDQLKPRSPSRHEEITYALHEADHL